MRTKWRIPCVGAHSVGVCRVRNSGFRGPWDSTSLRFDNLYFRTLLNASRWVYDGNQFNSASGDGTMMLQADIRMATDPIFSSWSRLFASDELVWFQKFSESFQKLGELGHDDAGLIRADYTLKTFHIGGRSHPVARLSSS